jgi:DNA repair exonuclease SbcCD nuclease subunit
VTLLITADWQLSSNKRDAYRFDNLLQLVDIIEKHKPSHLLILGDLTEEKNYHADQLVNDIVELLYNIACLCPIIVLEGNHDAAGDQAYFEFLRRVTNVTWVDRPTRMTLDKMGCLFLPATNNPEKDWAHPTIFGNLPHWIFAHHTFATVETESGFHLRGTPLDLLPIGAHVISGDIHTPQFITDNQRSVTYVGAPYSVDFGDDFAPQVLLVDGKTILEVPMVGAQKRLLDIDYGFNPHQAAHPINQGDIVKVRYQLKADERERWPQIKADLRKKIESWGCTVYAVLPIAPPAATLSVRSASRQRRSDEQVLEDFAKRQKVPGPILEVGLEIVKTT